MAEERIEAVADPDTGLLVRYTDNDVKPGDPTQLAEEVNKPLELGENGLPVILGGV